MGNKNDYLTLNQTTKSKKPFYLFLLLIPIVILFIILFFSTTKETHTDNYTEGWESNIVISEDLDSIFNEDYNIKAYDAIENALDEYFIQLYPNGAGINFTKYDDSTENNCIVRLITSYGSFHDLVITYNKKESTSITIKIDDTFNETYDLNYTRHEEEEQEEE